MCGFVGFINNIDNAEHVIEEMTQKIIHRGPDSKGRYIDENIALGFRRLSIIDLNDGDQPMFNEDKSIVIVFNGEIYNYIELREELIDSGHVFASKSDTEVIIHGYEQYGTDVLIKLRGMFSFVLYDKKNNILFGARDYFGIKPFYYADMGTSFMFGSEIKSFLPHPGFVKKLNYKQLENYLSFQYSPECETLFENVYKLPPAHYFIYKNGKTMISRYYQIEFTPDNNLTIDNCVDLISNAFNNSVKAHKISDVEVGSFLSSGVDSSYVAAVADVGKTFTVGFGENEHYNEITWAKNFSEYIGKENYSKTITAEEYWSSISKIQYFMDEPLADPSCIALYFVCKKASEQVKVVLSGEGADEIFGGYNIYKEPIEAKLYRTLPFFLRKAISNVIKKMPAKRGVNFLVRRGKRLEEWFIGNAFMFTENERKLLIKFESKAESPQQLTAKYYKKSSNYDAVTKMQYLDLHLWMVGDILLKADKMSMANSLELRVPFLDKEIMEVAEKIPTKFRVNKQNTKYAMRLAARKYMPPESAEKKKLGFPVPIRVWLRDDKYYSIVKSAFKSEIAKQFFNTEYILNLLEEHKLGKSDNSRKIWTVYIFIQWYEIFFCENPIE